MQDTIPTANENPPEQSYPRSQKNTVDSLLSKPLVSVSIPTFNSAKTIVKCLDSIRDQTYPNIEIIVMDGGSTDDTLKIARSANARIYSGGDLAQRRLLGARVSRGQYVVMLDSDQVLAPATIETCVETCDNGGWDALVLAETAISTKTKVQKTIALDRYLVHQYASGHPIYGTGLARFFNRNFLQKIRWPEHVNANDHAWIQYACWKAGGKIRFTDALIYHHEPRTLTEYTRKFYRWGYHYTSELGTNPTVTFTHALPRQVYFSKLALRNPLIFGLAFLYVMKVISAGLGGGKYVFESLWSRTHKHTLPVGKVSPVPNRSS